MTITVPQIRTWNAESLSAASTALADLAMLIDGQRVGLESEQTVLAESWRGDAAIAAAERVVSESSTFAKLVAVIEVFALDFLGAAAVVAPVRRQLMDLVDDLESRNYEVADYGVVTADRSIETLRQLVGPLAEDAILALQISCQEATISVCTGLQHASKVATDVCDRVRARVSAREQLLPATGGGELRPADGGGFSWTPDYQAMAAGVTIGAVSDATGHGLATAAAASSDNLAHSIGRRLGPAGAVIWNNPCYCERNRRWNGPDEGHCHGKRWNGRRRGSGWLAGVDGIGGRRGIGDRQRRTGCRHCSGVDRWPRGRGDDGVRSAEDWTAAVGLKK